MAQQGEIAQLAAAIQQLQTQVQVTQQENQVLRDRLTTFEAQQQVGGSPTAGGALPVQEVLQALQQLPDALAKMGKPKGLIDPRGLGKPQVLGDDADTRFRL